MVDFPRARFTLCLLMSAINFAAIVTELGFTIALPLIALLWLGIKADAAWHTTPLFIITAVIVSPFLSALAIWRKIKRLNNQTSV